MSLQAVGRALLDLVAAASVGAAASLPFVIGAGIVGVTRDAFPPEPCVSYLHPDECLTFHPVFRWTVLAMLTAGALYGAALSASWRTSRPRRAVAVAMGGVGFVAAMLGVAVYTFDLGEAPLGRLLRMMSPTNGEIPSWIDIVIHFAPLTGIVAFVATIAAVAAGPWRRAVPIAALAGLSALIVFALTFGLGELGLGIHVIGTPGAKVMPRLASLAAFASGAIAATVAIAASRRVGTPVASAAAR